MVANTGLVGGYFFDELCLVDLLQRRTQRLLHGVVVAGGLRLPPGPEHLERALVGGGVGALFDLFDLVVRHAERLAQRLPVAAHLLGQQQNPPVVQYVCIIIVIIIIINFIINDVCSTSAIGQQYKEENV